MKNSNLMGQCISNMLGWAFITGMCIAGFLCLLADILKDGLKGSNWSLLLPILLLIGAIASYQSIGIQSKNIRILWDFKTYAPFCGSRGLYDGNSPAADGAPNNEFISQIESHRSPLTGIVIMSAEDWESLKTKIREAGRSNHVN